MSTEPNKPQEFVDKVVEEFSEFNDTKDETSVHDASDIEQNKGMAVLCYLFLLWFIPFLTGDRTKSPFLRFHIQQGLTLLIFTAILWVVSGILSIIPFIGWIIPSIAGIISLVFVVIGVINVVNGRAKELPLIGGIHILK